MELLRKLRQRVESHNPVKVGIVGCGQMGSGLASSINNIDGMAVKAIADIDAERPLKALAELGIARDDIVITDSQTKAEDALRDGKVLVTHEALLLPQLEGLEANVEVTGITEIGAKVAWQSIANKKPVIMLNVETDITIGYLLDDIARKNGALYTVASGDEPGVCKMLYEQARLMGFEVVCLGKGKNNPINFDADPEDYAEEAASKEMNPKILTSFVDGTKTMVEMAAVANATGLVPDVPGMHGPKVELQELVDSFIPAADGGIFSTRGCVDYTTGPIAPGVFAIVYSDDPHIRKDMKFITKAEGPYYLHFRPYHLCNIETPQSIAEAVLLGERTVTCEQMTAEVVAVAKRDLKAGERIRGIGSGDMFGRIYKYAEARAQRAIPMGIAPDGIVRADVQKGEALTEENFAPDRSTFIYQLRGMQDSLLKMKGGANGD